MHSTLRKFLPTLVAIFTLCLASVQAELSKASSAPAANWKGAPYEHIAQFGALTGMGLLGGRAGLSVLATAAVKISHDGFISGVNDQAHVEIMAGPTFYGGLTGITFSTHLRWNFHYDEFWTYYAIGGIGGTIARLGTTNLSVVHPRFGVGALWHLFEHLSFRAEITQELVVLGVVYTL